MVGWKIVLPVLVAGTLFAATPLTAARHELTDNRATLVLREPTHLSVTMYITLADALHRALAPQSTLAQFVLTYAAIPAPQFQQELRRAQQRFQAGMRITGADGMPLALREWRWPDAATVQMALKQQAMQLVVAPDEHAHAEPMEIHAEVATVQPIRRVTVQFPAEFQRVLVVSYVPKQVWADPRKPAPLIAFD